MPDREKVIKALECCTAYYINNDLTGHERCPYNGRNDGDGCNKLYADALELLKQPKVVRCKDCKWYIEGYDIDGKWFTHCDGSVRTYGHTRPDWFCADGERKDD